MPAASDACLRCGASLSFMERFGLENAVEVPGKGALCPSCYRELSADEYNRYFKA
ncbi:MULTISPECIES: hypothetical protein [Neomoorella]|jgi:NMD protein affecting ribosome stability and mRNA decay|uniref:hypothetical protein n=1 Tax=Neomoorella TaxID=44260 RepID=UPI0010FFABF0|nr:MULTISPECIES: hypothetical protein [unclassified Moorella (in: firmicutes)]MDK2816978.1 hypothetical protein [Moorella sp. (in: firmicutes)]MDK2895064.1 hypothetical protein [Moorella sp. (in: firmicutes)]GEA14704.1 hypothetical protein E308F_09460 [Moorella sp. E308F]GEA17922.1 hypothetical protein E306M_10560 [Moorella sp. E306M]